MLLASAPGVPVCVLAEIDAAFWCSKFEANVTRDRRTTRELEALGWGVLVVWECETRDTDALRKRLVEFLNNEEEVRGHDR